MSKIEPQLIPATTKEQHAVVFMDTPEKVQRLWNDDNLAFQDAVALANAYGKTTLVRKATVTLHELRIGANGAS